MAAVSYMDETGSRLVRDDRICASPRSRTGSKIAHNALWQGFMGHGPAGNGMRSVQ